MHNARISIERQKIQKAEIYQTETGELKNTIANLKNSLVVFNPRCEDWCPQSQVKLTLEPALPTLSPVHKSSAATE